MTHEILTQSQSAFCGEIQLSSDGQSKRRDVSISTHKIKKGPKEKAFQTIPSKETLK
ncbi:MAG: hypothetical protein ABJM43_20645 [Paracoccaceae bacterium]